MEELGEFCRHVENYLGRKNAGPVIHLIGPRFELVQGWFARGIPLSIVTQGIDRVFERRQSKPAARRPVLIEFCEADVLDVFDEWRRAVGVAGSGIGDPGSEESGASRAGAVGSLPAHLERVIARLTAMRAGSDRSLDTTLDTVVQALDAVRAQAKSARGEARDALLTRLTELDTLLLAALRQRCDEKTRQQLEADADEELRPYRARMPAEAYRESHRAAVDRLFRERARMPVIAFE